MRWVTQNVQNHLGTSEEVAFHHKSFLSSGIFCPRVFSVLGYYWVSSVIGYHWVSSVNGYHLSSGIIGYPLSSGVLRVVKRCTSSVENFLNDSCKRLYFSNGRFYFERLTVIYRPPHDKTNKKACAPSEDSDQPGHPPSLVKFFGVRMKKA